MDTLVSIVIPVYNDRLVVEAVDSALNQTYSNVEVVVVDDGSEEYIEEILRPYMNRIKYIRTENHGVGAARNKGIENSVGEYIAFLDSDDLFLPEKIEKQYAFMKENNAVFSYTGYKRLKQGAFETLSVDYIGECISFPRIIYNCAIAMPTVMIKRSIISQNKLFNVNVSIGEDVCAWIDIAYENELWHLKEVLSIVRVDSDSCAYNIPKLQKAILNIIEHCVDNYIDYNEEIRKLILYYASLFECRNVKKLKILFLNKYWLTGGVERVVSNLANGLDGFADVYIYIYSDMFNCKYTLSSNVLISNVDNGNDNDTAEAIVEYVKKNEIDIVIGNSGIDSSLNIYDKLIDAHIKIIVCNHESYFYPHRFIELAGSASKRLRLLRDASIVTFTTPYSATAYNAFNANGIVVPNLLSRNVNLDFRKVKTDNRNIILAVGRWDDYNKHLDKIIEVFARVKTVKKDCELYVVGNVVIDKLIHENAKETIEQEIDRLSLNVKDIHFIGEVEDVEKYYYSSDVLLLTSETEAFAMVLAEAGGYGVPAVIMSIPGIDDYVIKNGVNGFICEQNDYECMANKVIELLSDDALYENISEAAVRLADRFSKDRIIEEWKKILTIIKDGNDEELDKLKKKFLEGDVSRECLSNLSMEYQKSIDDLLKIIECQKTKRNNWGNMSKRVLLYLRRNGFLPTAKKIIHKIKERV